MRLDLAQMAAADEVCSVILQDGGVDELWLDCLDPGVGFIDAEDRDSFLDTVFSRRRELLDRWNRLPSEDPRNGGKLVAVDIDSSFG